MRNAIILIFLLNFSIIFGNDRFSDILRDDFKSARGDYEYLFKSIAKLQPKDSYPLLITAALGISAYYYDEDVKSIVQSNKTPTLTSFTNILNYGGEPLTISILPGLVYLAGYAFEDEKMRSAGRLAYEANLLSGSVVGITKFVVGRARPSQELGNSEFDMFSFENEYNSFPSGHSAMAFSMATIFAHKINKAWAYPLMYALAGSTAYSRIYKNRHWLSDVVVGSAVGTISALALLKSEQNRLQDEKFSTIPNSIPIVRFVYNY